MSELKINALASNGVDFEYEEMHRWKYLPPDAQAQFIAKGQQAATQAKAAAGTKEDAANITLTLSSVVDGQAQPDVVVPGLSQVAFTKLQRKGHNEAGNILSMGEKHAKSKQQGQRGNH
jgi:hypothetical protein